KLLVCSQRECPGVLREDCAGVLREVERATPSIVLSAADREGRDLADVKVTLGGATLTEHLDGRSVTVDPGKLVLRFEHAPWPAETMEIVVVEGEKNRKVRATLGPQVAAVAAGGGPSEAPAADASERGLVGWAVPVGLGVVGAGA